LLELWVRGLELEWSKLWGEEKPQRIDLPVYPFAKERYWIEVAAVSGQAAIKGRTTAVLHPLLHSNTSDLSEQRYSATFTGEEFFLADHQVRMDGRTVQKVLPGVAYLEMARAAIEQALPTQPESSILELHNTVWLTPAVVTEDKQLSIAVFANDNDQLDYEIYSIESEQKIIHCQGQAALVRQPAPGKLDIGRLREQMGQKRLEASQVYVMFAKMGLNYGPAHQGIKVICVGEQQLLAQLVLPTVVERSHHEYVLHPSLMDSALQASIGLVADSNYVPIKPSVPFALGTLRIVSTCTKEMFAWVRYTPGSEAGDQVVKLDVDLCDERGNVCVQMQGFSSRVLEGEMKLIRQKTISKLAQDKSNLIEDRFIFDAAFYEKLIADILNRDISVDEAVDLG
jgi:polyketide synthase PksN